MRKVLMILSLLPILMGSVLAQETQISAELRPRAEYRNGYRGLTKGGDALVLISQRSSLNFTHQQEKLKIGIGIRDVRVWGQTGTLELDGSTTAINESWAEILINTNWSVKVGRQSLLYSDGRIMATNNWNQLGRYHDAVVFKMENDSLFTLHFGGAYNHNRKIDPAQIDFYIVNNYKTMFFSYLKKDINKVRLEGLYLANGMQNIDDSLTYFSHTGGVRVQKFKGDFKPELSFYYQGGKNRAGQVVQAYMATISAKYKLNERFSLQVGSDYISGEEYDENSSVDHRFDLLYGYRHKYYGTIDYFYIGGNTNYGLGFSDTYLKVNYKTENNWNFYLTGHQFLSGNDIIIEGENYSKNLATEFDFGFSHKVTEAIKLAGGYSQIFSSKTHGKLENADYQNNNNWVWLQLEITPVLFKYKVE